MLPLLRETGTQGQSFVNYDIPLLGDFVISFTLHWTAPFMIALLACGAVAFSKRIEYQLIFEGHTATKQRAEELLGDMNLGGGEKNQIRSVARGSGVAFRRLAICLLNIFKSALASTILLLLEPAALLVTFLVVVALMVFFQRTIWRVASYERAKKLNGLGPRVRHRLRLVNSQQIFLTLMPLTIAIILALARVSEVFNFDLAGLILLAILISVIGSSIGSILQTLLRLHLRETAERRLLHAIRWGPPQAARRMLRNAR